MTRLYNRTSEKPKRKMLRSNMPRAEIILWTKLKNKQIGGHKFRRQYSIGKFVIDFYCPGLKLAIEVDGESHFVRGANLRDKERQGSIEQLGISFLRFKNSEIYENIGGVLETISRKIEGMTSPTPP